MFSIFNLPYLKNFLKIILVAIFYFSKPIVNETAYNVTLAMVFLQVTHVNYLTPEKIVKMPVVAFRHDKSHKKIY